MPRLVAFLGAFSFLGHCLYRAGSRPALVLLRDRTLGAVPVLLSTALLLSACGHATSPLAQAIPTATVPAATATAMPTASALVATATATPAIPTATPTATPNAVATVGAYATAAASLAQAQAVDHLGAGNTLLQAGNLDGALHEYATAQGLGPARPDIASAIATAQALQTATAQAEAAPVSNSSLPVRLAIPALGVNAPVEILGLLSDGSMQAPVGWWDAGWYRYGPLPGQTGNAVIAGHLDSTTGPALFWRLTSLGGGDQVIVTLSSGQVEDFLVQRQVSYRDNSAPMGEIFGPAATANLNLITCGGIWNAALHNYSNRTVIYTRKA
jgi:sortase (surface protein transpeptidase)